MIIDTVITIQERRLRALLANGLRRAQQAGRPVLVSIVLRAPAVDPLAFFERGARLAGAREGRLAGLLTALAFRTALLDLQHVTTLVGYLAALARRRGDAGLAAWHDDWERRLSRPGARGRAAAAAMAADPEAAIAPADEGTLGRAGAKLGVAVGTLGEAIDNSRLGRLARRRAT